ncbi:MAG: potassium transporter TrkG [Brachymonas sp.]|nr:potassium transporter TrkG [Brachymonas sp.]
MLKNRFSHPSAIVVMAFMGMIILSTAVLMLPVARADRSVPADWLVALFTAVSAVCVNGLSIVDTGTYWSPFGHVALMVMFQIGGFGMMVSATLMGLWAARSLKLRMRVLLQSETRALSLGDVRGVLAAALIATLVIELLVALWIALRLALAYGKAWGEALWLGLFHAVSGFNNAGFALFPDGVAGFAGDFWILLPVMLSIVIGGLGFPVLYELWQRLRMVLARGGVPRMSIHAHITLLMSLALLLLGVAGILAFEWNNSRTLAPLSWSEKWQAALFTSVAARTAGFNVLDLGSLQTESYVLHYLLMFVGAGSSGTGGGIKVTTVGVLLAAVWSELRGYPDAEFAGRRIHTTVLRQALTLLVLASGMVVLASLVIMPMVDLPYERIMFEILSAFSTTGASTGITAQLPVAVKLILIALMFIGRVGVVTLCVALAAKPYRASYRYPEEKPIVG